MTQPTSTADYRKYPKGPNFLLIVILACITIVLFFIGAYLFLSDDGRKLLPKLHRSHPTSFVMPHSSGTVQG